MLEIGTIADAIRHVLTIKRKLSLPKCDKKWSGKVVPRGIRCGAARKVLMERSSVGCGHAGSAPARSDISHDRRGHATGLFLDASTQQSFDLAARAATRPNLPRVWHGPQRPISRLLRK